MDRRFSLLVLMLACVACSKVDTRNGSQPLPIAVNEANIMTSLDPESTQAGGPGGLPEDRTPVSESAIDPKSAQGAGQVLQLFGSLLEQRRFADAYRLWSDSGRASGLSEGQFIAAYDKYADIQSEVGTPGQMEGAAGSSYVDIPFRLYGKLNNGSRFNLVGPVTLRRVNDVPGSTEEQRRWHIYKSDLNARP